MLITGSRDGRLAVVDGASTGLEGERLTPWMRPPGPHAYEPAPDGPTVSDEGTFTWERATAKKMYLYFRADEGVRSNRVIIPAKVE